MKTIKLSKLLLGIILFSSVYFTTASAETMKCGVGKCGSSTNTPKVKEKNEKWNPKTYDTPKMNSNVYENNGWIKQDTRQEYQRGEIRTH